VASAARHRFELPDVKNQSAIPLRSAGALHSSSIPKSLLQLTKSLNNLFLHQVLTLGNDRLAGNNDLAYGRARERKNNAGKQGVSRGPGDRWIVKRDRKKIRGLTGLECAAGRANAARAVPGGALK
jgi:hypothetical protein